MSFSFVEQHFLKCSNQNKNFDSIPYIISDNFPSLGLLTSLRFLEWVSENPEGLISLPTGKTPEYFIKWTEYILDHWESTEVKQLLDEHQCKVSEKPRFDQLSFVQIDEFYPISSEQHNSFAHYVQEFYIKKLGLNPDKALLINCDDIHLAENKHFSEIFPDNKIDLSLRNREATNSLERLQQESIFLIDQWCSNYESQIRAKGGIGFFLGGIGPDGHIAFNIKGSDHFSTTRLIPTNFETQAAAAGDLGGIEISKNKLVITIGLETITYNPNCVAIIIAAGEAKAELVKNSIISSPSNLYPATALKKLKNSRFYLTKGAASRLPESIDNYYKTGEWNLEKSAHAVLNLCKKIEKYSSRITMDDLLADETCKNIKPLGADTPSLVSKFIENKILKGTEAEKNQVFLHTGPHHDDIMLGILPYISHQMTQKSNEFHCAVLTSGFTAVTNQFLLEAIEDCLQLLEKDKIEMIHYPDFFEKGFKFKWMKDVSHYLNKVADNDLPGQKRGLSHRIIRCIVEIYKIKDAQQLQEQLRDIFYQIDNSYDGEKNAVDIQKLKGMIREYEEELVWGHFGIQVKNIHHLRLGFYTGDIFTQQPTEERDVQPMLELLRQIKPSIISLAMDPEGSGPDTHYKVLQVIAEAVRLYKEERTEGELKIIGYRNVWYRFHPAEADKIYPVSLNDMAVLKSSFKNCYMSQLSASFPSYELDGPFSSLTQKIWVEQMEDIQLLLGKDYFYENPDPKLRAAHGMLYFKEMTEDEFLANAATLRSYMER
jgi:glucosamine-6-phosphate deaminase